MKLTISPTVISPRRASTAPTAKITTMTMVAEARVRMVSSAHQVSTGYWAASSRRIMPCSSRGLGGEAGVALHHGDVADHVADAAEHVLVVALDRHLAGLGAADDDEVDRDIDHGQGRQQAGQPRVHEERRGHQEGDADHGRRGARGRSRARA